MTSTCRGRQLDSPFSCVSTFPPPSTWLVGIRVNETLLASVEVRLETRKGETIFEEIGRNVGLEVQGDLERLQRGES